MLMRTSASISSSLSQLLRLDPLPSYDRYVAVGHGLRRSDKQLRIEARQLTIASRKIGIVDRPGGVDLDNQLLQVIASLVGPIELLEHWLIDEAVPEVAHGGAVSEDRLERSGRGTGRSP